MPFGGAPMEFLPTVNSKSVCILKYPPAASARLQRGERPPPRNVLSLSLSLFDERSPRSSSMFSGIVA